MKRLIGLSFFILFLLFNSLSYGAETMVVATDGYGKVDASASGSRLRALKVTCTTDTDGSFSYQLTEDMWRYLQGWIITSIRVSNTTAQTDPTASSDLYLRRASAGGAYTTPLDMLHGAGVDKVTNDSELEFAPKDISGAPSVIYVVDQFFVEVENNSVNSAAFNITFIAVPTR